MKIAIFDIDDSIVEETRFMIENAPSFLKKKYKIERDIINKEGYDLKEVFALKEYFIENGLTEEEAIKKSDKINQDFWNQNFIKYCMMPIKPGVKELIDFLKLNDYYIQFVSTRGKKSSENSSFIKDFIRLQIVPLLTKIQLANGNISYDSLKLVKSKQEKIDYINAMSPDFVFEDQTDTINAITSKSNIYCISNSHNINSKLNENVTRINDFDLHEFERKLLDMANNEKKDEKNNKKAKTLSDIKIINPLYLRKILTEANYSLVKLIGTPILNSKIKPIVKGNENILKTGSVAFVGSHRNKLDPALVTTTQNRKLHWGALLRMFQGKENLFSEGKHPIPCYLSAAFITSVGAVPIARKTDENYMNINLKSIEMLGQMLKWDGAVGLFPEGTLNREPDKQNILPLKSNRIFRLVKAEDGFIQPFSIVWVPDNLDVENKAIVNYGFPINTRNKDIKEISLMWNQVVDSQIEESNSLIEQMRKINETITDKEEKNKEVKKLVKQFRNK